MDTDKSVINPNYFFKVVLTSCGIFVANLGIGVGLVEMTRTRGSARVIGVYLNDDKIKDLIVQTKGDTYVFLGQEDGSYKNLDDFKNELISASEAQVNALEAKVETTIKELK